MKQKLLRRILLISSAVFFVGVVICFLLFVLVNIIGARHTLDNVAAEYNGTIASAESLDSLAERVESTEASLLRISVFSSDGAMIADNSTEDMSDVTLDDDLAAQLAQGDSVYRMQRLYGMGETLYVLYNAVPTDLDEGGYLIVVYGADIDFNDINFWALAGACLVGWIVITIATYLLTRNYIVSATASLDKLRVMLENVNKGNYSEIDYKSPYRDVQEIVDNIDVAARNINDTIKELKNEQIKNSFILSNIAQGVVAVNDKQRVIISNDAFSDIFGSVPGLVGAQLSDVIGEDDDTKKIFDALKEGRTGAVTELTRSGKTYRVENVAEPEHWPEAWGATGAMLLFTDITFEANMSKLRSEFFDNASHELKTPLTAISGYAELLGSKGLSAAKRDKCVSEIRENASGMLDLINNMLKLSKLDVSDRPRDLQDTDLAEVCRSVVEKLQVQAREADVTIACSGEASVFADKDDVYSMISNVVSNAIKYNKRGGSVTISLRQTDDAASVTVEDTGIGIAPEHIGRIFDRFYKVDTARTRSKALSTGLGLSIVKQLADHYGAKIQVESEVGKGTRVSIVFGRGNDLSDEA